VLGAAVVRVEAGLKPRVPVLLAALQRK
jgi:hypothetical protein